MKFKLMKFIIVCLDTCILILVSCLFSCHTIKPVVPPHSSEISEAPLKPSTISLPINVDMKDLELKINKDFVGLIYEDDNLHYNDNVKLMIKAWKKDTFKISSRGNELAYRIPLKIWLKYDVKFEKFGLKVGDSRELYADIAIKFRTAITINKDWTISTKTTTDGYDWLNAPKVTIAGIDLPVTYVADMIYKASQNKINTEIDKAINKNLDLKKYAQDAWNKLQNPFNVNTEYNAWLKITPVSITTMPINGNNNNLNITVGISSVNEVYIGKQPVLSDLKPLPDINIVNKLDPIFSININTDIAFTKINELAQKELVGKVFTEGKHSIEIKELNIYGSENRFVVETTLTGSLKGKIYMTGKPVYNHENKTIEIKEVDFDIKTKNVLVKSAEWLLHGKFIKMIEPKLNYSIAGRIDEAKNMLQPYLKNNKSITGMTLNGELKNIDIDNIYVTDESIRVIIDLKGALSVNVDGLSKM